MNKYEFEKKIELGEELIEERDYEGAVAVFDELNLNLVDQPRRLQVIADAYERCKRYEDAEDILLIALEMTPKSRGLLEHLCLVALKIGEIKEAKEYYQDFCLIGKEDPVHFVLAYKIAVAENAPDDKLIRILEQYKRAEPDDRYLFELAELYARNGRYEDAAQICDDIDLWFNSGKYLEKAHLLRDQLGGLPNVPATANPSDPFSNDEIPNEVLFPEEEEKIEAAAEEPAPEEGRPEEATPSLVLEESEPLSFPYTLEAEQAPEEKSVPDYSDEVSEEIRRNAPEILDCRFTLEAGEMRSEAERFFSGDPGTFRRPVCSSVEEVEMEGLFRADEQYSFEGFTAPKKHSELFEEAQEAIKLEPKPADELGTNAPDEHIVFSVTKPQDVGNEFADDTEENEVIDAADGKGLLEVAENNGHKAADDKDASDERRGGSGKKKPAKKKWRLFGGSNDDEEDDDLDDGEEEVIPDAEAYAQAEEDVPAETEEDVPAETEEDVPAETEDDAPAETEEDVPAETEDDASAETKEDVLPETEEDILPETEAEEVPDYEEDESEAEDYWEIEESEETKEMKAEEARIANETDAFGLPVDGPIVKNTWHFLVFGKNPVLTLQCAREKIQELSERNVDCPTKLLKITAEKIGAANIRDVLERFVGNMVIVEQAASLSPKQLQDFAELLKPDDHSLLVAFTDTRANVLGMLKKAPALRQSFTSVFEGRQYTSQDLYQSARLVAFRKGARMTESGEDYMQDFCDQLIEEQQGFYEAAIDELLEGAISEAEKGGFLGIGAGKRDREGYLLLSEKHFRKAGNV